MLWGSQMAVLTPALPRTSLTHLERVLEVTEWWGLVKRTKKEMLSERRLATCIETIVVQTKTCYVGIHLITISQNSRCRAEGRVFKSLYSNISPYPARSPLLLKGVQVEGHMVSVLSDEGPQPGQTAHPGK